MITGVLVTLAVLMGAAAVGFGAASGIALERGDRALMRFATGVAFGLMAAALALMWWAA